MVSTRRCWLVPSFFEVVPPTCPLPTTLRRLAGSPPSMSNCSTARARSSESCCGLLSPGAANPTTRAFRFGHSARISRFSCSAWRPSSVSVLELRPKNTEFISVISEQIAGSQGSARTVSVREVSPAAFDARRVTVSVPASLYVCVVWAGADVPVGRDRIAAADVGRELHRGRLADIERHRAGVDRYDLSRLRRSNDGNRARTC